MIDAVPVPRGRGLVFLHANTSGRDIKVVINLCKKYFQTRRNCSAARGITIVKDFKFKI